MSTRSGLIFGGPARRSALALARETLRAERAEATRVMREHRRTFALARARVRRDGRRLLRVIDHLPERD